MIGTIRGIVEIEQAKRDRSLERTVQVIGKLRRTKVTYS